MIEHVADNVEHIKIYSSILHCSQARFRSYLSNPPKVLHFDPTLHYNELIQISVPLKQSSLK